MELNVELWCFVTLMNIICGVERRRPTFLTHVQPLTMLRVEFFALCYYRESRTTTPSSQGPFKGFAVPVYSPHVN